MLKKYTFCLLIGLSVSVNATTAPYKQHAPTCEVIGHDAAITYDLLSGTGARSSNEPRLTVRNEGIVVLGNSYGLSQRIEKQVDQTQTQQLLDFIVEKNNFFAIDVPAIQKQIREERFKTGRLFVMADSIESVISVCSGKQQKEVKFYALSHAAKQFPEIRALQQLYAIEQELKRTETWLRVGGDEGAQSVLKYVNEYLSRKHSEVTPLTLGNLISATTDTDGNVTIYFSRRGFKLSDTGMRNMSVIAYRPFGINFVSTVTVNLE